MSDASRTGHAIAVFDGAAYGPNCVSLQTGDNVYLHPPTDTELPNGWAYGIVGGREGWFPTAFVARTGYAIGNFNPSDYGPNAIRLQKGDEVQHVDLLADAESMGGWAWGTNGTSTGWFPEEYVTPRKPARSAVEIPREHTPVVGRYVHSSRMQSSRRTICPRNSYAVLPSDNTSTHVVKCAHLMCPFQPHSCNTFGGYCCSACQRKRWMSIEQIGQGTAHDADCEGNRAPRGSRRAEETHGRSKSPNVLQTRGNQQLA